MEKLTVLVNLTSNQFTEQTKHTDTLSTDISDIIKMIRKNNIIIKMMNLNFENANVYYQQDFLTNEQANKLFDDISQLFDHEENKLIVLDKTYRLNRKTMVYVDQDVDINVIQNMGK